MVKQLHQALRRRYALLTNTVNTLPYWLVWFHLRVHCLYMHKMCMLLHLRVQRSHPFPLLQLLQREQKSYLDCGAAEEDKGEDLSRLQWKQMWP